MISIQDALQIIQENIAVPKVTELPLDQTPGRYISEDLMAPEPSPRFTNSAMDGYAACWEDIVGANTLDPAVLRIVGESQAGIPFVGTVGKGEAVRISTGAMIAEGCDTVIPVEDTHETDTDVTILSVSQKSQHVRFKGEEFDKGSLLLRANTRISAPQVALMASVGVESVKVYRPCEVALLVTGSELVSSSESIAEHQIRDSNMIMLKTAIIEAGAKVVSCERVTDDKEATIAMIGQVQADIVLCSGGVSMGRHDHVKEAAEKNNYQQLFWKISQKPGKPLYFARKEDTLLFGLPGNPVSAFMCFAHYVRPIISAFSGLPFGWPTVSGEVGEDISNKGKRANMIRVKIAWRAQGGYGITNAEKQGSHMLTSLADADGYVIVDSGQTLRAGEIVSVYCYDFRRDPL